MKDEVIEVPVIEKLPKHVTIVGEFQYTKAEALESLTSKMEEYGDIDVIKVLEEQDFDDEKLEMWQCSALVKRN